MVHKPAPAPTGTTPAGNLHEAELKAVIGYQMAQASVVMDRLYEEAVGKHKGLHRVEYTLLMLVRANPGCTASSLAKALAVSAPNMALWLERIAAKGLLDRTPSAADRRSNHLRLTQRGEDASTAATQAIPAAEQALLGAARDLQQCRAQRAGGDVELDVVLCGHRGPQAPGHDQRDSRRTPVPAPCRPAAHARLTRRQLPG